METTTSTDPTPLTPPPATTITRSQVQTWCVLCHASALLGVIIPGVAHIVAPLIVWLVKRNDSPEIDAHGKESLNFQLSMLIWCVISAILVLIAIGIVALIILGILNIVFVIVASIKASEGVLYRYPMTIRFIK